MMKKMTYRDLTPELLNELYSCVTAEALISACAAKELHLSQASAESLMQTLKKARELGRENLEKVAGGGKGYAGTRKLRADECVNDCYWDVGCDEDCYFYDLNCWDANGDNIDDDNQPSS